MYSYTYIDQALGKPCGIGISCVKSLGRLCSHGIEKSKFRTASSARVKREASRFFTEERSQQVAQCLLRRLHLVLRGFLLALVHCLLELNGIVCDILVPQ